MSSAPSLSPPPALLEFDRHRPPTLIPDVPPPLATRRSGHDLCFSSDLLHRLPPTPSPLQWALPALVLVAAFLSPAVFVGFVKTRVMRDGAMGDGISPLHGSSLSPGNSPAGRLTWRCDAERCEARQVCDCDAAADDPFCVWLPPRWL